LPRKSDTATCPPGWFEVSIGTFVVYGYGRSAGADDPDLAQLDSSHRRD
jgi:hypothetical protein